MGVLALAKKTALEMKYSPILPLPQYHYHHYSYSSHDYHDSRYAQPLSTIAHYLPLNHCKDFGHAEIGAWELENVQGKGLWILSKLVCYKRTNLEKNAQTFIHYK